MSCDDVQNILDGYFDGEIDLSRSLEIERHLAECADCSHALDEMRSLRSALTAAHLSFDAPEGLTKRIRKTLPRETGRNPIAHLRVSYVLVAAAAIACVGIVLWRGPFFFGRSTSEGTLADQIIQSHIRSLMPNHLTDVPSTDQHTVKPWFNGKVDYSPSVKDLSSAGFPLVGGRLDYIGDRAVAVLVYQRRQHVINLFTWPLSRSPASELSQSTMQGYHMLPWHDGQMEFCAVSDLNLEELEQFSRIYQE